MLIIDIAKIELTGGHIGFMLIIEIPKLILSVGHIVVMLFIEFAKKRVNRRLFWNDAY